MGVGFSPYSAEKPDLAVISINAIVKGETWTTHIHGACNTFRDIFEVQNSIEKYVERWGFFS